MSRTHVWQLFQNQIHDQRCSPVQVHLPLNPLHPSHTHSSPDLLLRPQLPSSLHFSQPLHHPPRTLDSHTPSSDSDTHHKPVPPAPQRYTASCAACTASSSGCLCGSFVVYVLPWASHYGEESRAFCCGVFLCVDVWLVRGEEGRELDRGGTVGDQMVPPRGKRVGLSGMGWPRTGK